MLNPTVDSQGLMRHVAAIISELTNGHEYYYEYYEIGYKHSISSAPEKRLAQQFYLLHLSIPWLGTAQSDNFADITRWKFVFVLLI